MSMSEDEYAHDEYMAQLYEEHKIEAIEEFTNERLKSYYSKNRFLAKPSFDVLNEAQKLFSVNATAGFILAAIAMEVGLKETLIKPIVFGLIHSVSSASLVTNLVMSHRSMDRYKDLLLQILREHGGVDLKKYKRSGLKKIVLDEINDVKQKRNKIMHTAETASHKEATLALGVASTILRELFPSVVTKIGLHIHDGFRICDDWNCEYKGTAMEKYLILHEK